MALRKTLFLFCLIASTLSLAGGYAVTGRWIGALVAVLSVPIWLLALKSTTNWLPAVSLVVSVGLAALGLIVNAPPFLMVIGSTAALAGWDLVLLDHSLKASSQPEIAGHLEYKHVQSLALALGIGLLLAVFSLYLSLQISFGWMVLLVIIDLFSLDQLARYFAERRNRNL